MAWGDHRYRGKEVPWATALPLYVHWPEGIGTAPGTIDAWALNIDLAPTLADLAGATLGPFPSGPSAPDGRSLLPLLRSRGADAPGRRWWVEEHRHPHFRNRRWASVRTTSTHRLGLWRYTEWENGGLELYDLVSDPWELDNRVEERPDVARALHRLLARARREGTAMIPPPPTGSRRR
jgi:arylsulfatase A-like enzyme